MAYGDLVSLARTIDQTLNHHHYSIYFHRQKQQIISIDKYVISLQAFLEDFPQKANSSLEASIRDVANEAEDVIEYFTWEQKPYFWWEHFQSHYRSVRCTLGRICCDFRLKKVSDKFESIAWEVMDIKNRFGIKELLLVDPPAASSSPRLAPAGRSEMVGFDDDSLAIKARLCGESSRLECIPIVGMGGIGKTTLARNAYDDMSMLQHFDIRAWVTVSQDYSWKQILTSLLDSMKLLDAEKIGQSDELMATYVYKNLKWRRYLIVLDDMWSVNAWDDVRMLFPDDGNRSRIMLTSRLSNVAAYPDPPSPLHEIHFMDPDQSWKLLRQKVFVQEDCPCELEDIGKEIARSCGGLPLAIVVIAGLLAKVSRTRSSWEEIAANVNSAVALEDDGRVERLLSLSYNHLPHHLRSCFLYMGGFPEDYEIRTSKLIKLWIAEGFLKHPNGSKSIEEGAEEHVEDLVERRLVLVTKRKPNGKIKSCSLHDLVRDLCIRKAQQEIFFVKLMNESSSLCNVLFPKRTNYQRRLSIAHAHLNCLANIRCCLTIRTITCFHCTVSSLGSLVNFRLLRVLDMSNSAGNSLQSFWSEEFDSLPDQVFELIHLRYLCLDYPVCIPAAISKLQNLQTLIIHPRKMWVSFRSDYLLLPWEMFRMSQLRHLACFSINLWHDLEEETFVLENLLTLSIAGTFRFTDEVLEMFPKLKKLSVTFHVDSSLDFDYLGYLRTLENLKMHIHAGVYLRRCVIPSLPPMLKKLTLIGCRLPVAIIGSLPYLQVLKLRDSAFDGGSWETTEGGFPQLNFLLIEKSNLQHWITESSHFPLLKCLLLHRCRFLDEIPEDIGEIPTLVLIEVENGNISLVKSAKRIQEAQQLLCNDILQVRCVHN